VTDLQEEAIYAPGLGVIIFMANMWLSEGNFNTQKKNENLEVPLDSKVRIKVQRP